MSLHLAKKGHKVWGIEVNEESIKSAQYTQKYNNIDAEYRAGKTEYFLKSSDLSNIDLVITDPPRRGMAESIDELCRLKPQYVFYELRSQYACKRYRNICKKVIYIRICIRF